MSDSKKAIAIVTVLILVFGFSYAEEDIMALFSGSASKQTEVAPLAPTTPAPAKAKKIANIPLPEPAKGPVAPPATTLPTPAVNAPYDRYKENVKGQSLDETLSSIQGSGIDEKKRAEQNLYFRTLVDQMRKNRAAGDIDEQTPEHNPNVEPIVIPGISLNPPEETAAGASAAAEEGAVSDDANSETYEDGSSGYGEPGMEPEQEYNPEEILPEEEELNDTIESPDEEMSEQQDMTDEMYLDEN